MKSPYYVATVTNAYRRRIDSLARGTATPAETALLQRELNAVSHRPYASGFYFGEMRCHAPEDGVYLQDCVFAAVVVQRLSGGRVRAQLRNRMAEGDALEVLSPSLIGLSFPARNLTDATGAPIACAAVPMMLFDMDAPDTLAPGDMLRMRVRSDNS